MYSLPWNSLAVKLAHERNFVVNNTNYATPVESAVLDVFKHTTATFMLIPFRISYKMMMMMFSKKLTKYKIHARIVKLVSCRIFAMAHSIKVISYL